MMTNKQLISPEFSYPQIQISDIQNPYYLSLNTLYKSTAKITISNLSSTLIQADKITIVVRKYPDIYDLGKPNQLSYNAHSIYVYDTEITDPMDLALTIKNNNSDRFNFYIIFSRNNIALPILPNIYCAVIENISLSIQKLPNTLLGAPNLSIDGISETITEEIIGLKNIRLNPSKHITLRWLNLNNQDNDEIWSALEQYGLEGADGQVYKLHQSMKSLKYKYHIFQYTSSNKYLPITKYPEITNNKQIDRTIYTSTGIWEYIGETSQGFFKVALPENKYVGFWVGIEIDDSSLQTINRYGEQYVATE